MGLLPEHWGSPLFTLSLLALLLVTIGLFLEPLGAVLLVSSTLAPVAYNNGIAPVHFWMVVLVAFELGYLLPPVALNQLLARQVVGLMTPADGPPPAIWGNRAPGGWWLRHEHWVLPAGVMTLALVIVTTAPLLAPEWVSAWGPLRQWLPMGSR